MNRRGSLAGLLILLALIAAVPLLGLLAYTTYHSWQERQRRAEAEAFTSVQFQAERVSDQLRAVGETLSLVGTLAATDPVDIAANDALLQEVKASLPTYYSGLALVDPQGRNIGFGVPREAAGRQQSVADRAYFQAALATRETVVGDPVISRSTGAAVIPIARSLGTPDGEVRVVALAAIELERVQELLAPDELPPASVITVLSDKGIVLARSLDPGAWIGRDISDTPSVQEALARREGVFVHTAADGVERVAAFAMLESAPWLIYVGIPKEVVFAPGQAALARDSLLGSLSLLGALALATWMATRIARPLVRLAEDALALGAGDLSRRAVVAAGGEIGVLARSFNQMADALAGDIARRARAEEALHTSQALLSAAAREQQQLYREEQRARAAAEQAVQLREQFLSIASHELRTPLTSVLIHAQAFQRRAEREGTLSERDRRSLQQIIAHAGRLNRMIGAMLDVGRIDQGRLQLDVAPLDLGALTREVVGGLQGTASHDQIALSGDEAPLWVAGDALRLEQVLQNLLGNAVKYSPAGGPITVSLAADGDTVQVMVCDNGIGIPAQDLPHIFQRFYRAGNVSADTMTGVGIGLYVVQEIMALHGGAVTVTSEEGRGSCFTVTLPRIAPPA